MPNLPQNWVELVTPGLGDIFDRGVGETAETHERENIFNVLPSERAFEEHLGVGSLSNEGWNYKDTGRVQFDTISKLWVPRFDHLPYAKGIEIEEELFEDNLYSDTGLPATITDQPAILGRNAEIQRENAAVEVFNLCKTGSGKTASGFSLAGPDGSALVASDHELYPDAAAADDQSNTFAYTLTAGNISLIRAAARKWTDNAGNPLGVRLSELIVPVDQADNAEVLMISNLKPGTANNDSNVAKVSAMRVWDFLTDGDLWFYTDPVLRKRLLLWYERKKLNFKSDAPLTTLTGRWRAQMRYSRGYVHWSFIAGSDGS